MGSLCVQRDVAAGQSADYTFLLAWRFPNRTPKRAGWEAGKGYEDTVVGNYYCTQFENSWAAAEHLADLKPVPGE